MVGAGLLGQRAGFGGLEAAAAASARSQSPQLGFGLPSFSAESAESADSEEPKPEPEPEPEPGTGRRFRVPSGISSSLGRLSIKVRRVPSSAGVASAGVAASVSPKVTPRGAAQSVLGGGSSSLRKPNVHLARRPKFRIVTDADTEQHPWIIDWDNRLRRMWDMLIAVAVVYVCFTVPIGVAFVDMNFNRTVELVLEIIFVVDIVLNFRTGFLRNGVHERSPRKIKERYMRTWFFVDALASTPLDMTIGATLDQSTRRGLLLLRWLQMARLLRVGRLLKYFQQRHMRYRRVRVLVFMTVLSVHLLGCAWLSIALPCDGLDVGLGVSLDASDAGVADVAEPTGMLQCSEEQMWDYYVLSLTRIAFTMFFQVSDTSNFVAYIDRGIYEERTASSSNASTDSVAGGGFSNMASLAWSDWTFFNEDRRLQTLGLSVLSVAGMLVGFFVTANFVAEAVVFSVNRMALYYKFSGKVDQIKKELVALQLPPDIQRRVAQYYDYLWITQKMGLGDKTHGVLNDADLSRPLRKEIALRVHGSLLEQTLFKGCSADCLFAIAMRLKTSVYLPGDLVFEKGDVARELFIIRKGVVAVLFAQVDVMETTKDDSATVKLMGPGRFFGEVALLAPMPRSCSVVSKTVSELHELGKTDFEECMLECPQLTEDVAKKVLQLNPGLKHKMAHLVLEATPSPKSPLPKSPPPGPPPPNPSVSEDDFQRIVNAAVGQILSKIEASTASILADLANAQAQATQLQEEQQNRVAELPSDARHRGTVVDLLVPIKGVRKASTLFDIDDIAADLGLSPDASN